LALSSNTTGNNSTAYGNNALISNITGGSNTAIGNNALFYNESGNYNTAIGQFASYFTLTNNNTSVGYSAGDYYTFTNGTFAGYGAYPNADDYTNCMALGYNARVTASNRVVIGNLSVTSIGGYAGWTDFSDQRYKTAIQENVKGLEFIMKLRPVTYKLDINRLAANLKEDQRRDADGKIIMGSTSLSDIESRDEKSRIVHTGFLAQEVEAAAKSIGFEFSGVDVPKNEEAFYGLRYAEFVVPLVKAVQELNLKNETQQSKIEEQQQIINQLLKRVELLESE